MAILCLASMIFNAVTWFYVWRLSVEFQEFQTDLSMILFSDESEEKEK